MTTAPDLAHYQQILAGLVDLGDLVARKLAARIDDASDAEAIELAGAVQNTARGVGRTILLSIHLHRAAERAVALRTAGRVRILREITDTISREGVSPTRAESLHRELIDRLDSVDLAPDLDGQIATRPLEDIILDLKRDMGLYRVPGTAPWPRRTPADIADLLAQARRPTASAQTVPHPTPS